MARTINLKAVAGVLALAVAVALMMLVVVLTTEPAEAAPQKGSRAFANGNIIMIPFNRISGGTGGRANPYPSRIDVSGFKKITDLDVTFRSVGHTDPDDLDVLLVGPTGRKAIIWSDAGGGNDIIGANIRFVDDQDGNALGASFLPDSGQITPGTYMTSNYEVGADTWPGVTQNNNRLLNTFYGTNPTGVWKLYVFDDVQQPDTGDRNGTGTFANGWSLKVTGVCTNPNANRACR